MEFKVFMGSIPWQYNEICQELFTLFSKVFHWTCPVVLDSLILVTSKSHSKPWHVCLSCFLFVSISVMKSSLAWLIIAQRVWAMRDYSFSAIFLMVGCRDVRTWIWQETCRHLYISVKAGRLRPPRMTDHKCTWSVGMTNQRAWIPPFPCAWHIWLHGFEPANFFFLLFWVATTSAIKTLR